MGGEYNGINNQTMLELEMKIKATIEEELNSKKKTESKHNKVKDCINSDNNTT